MRQIILDENISPKHAIIIQTCFRGVNVLSFKQLGFLGKPDVEWMDELSGKSPRPVIFTGDRNISHRKFEYEALKSSNLTYVVFTDVWNSLKFSEQVWRLVRHWDEICSVLQFSDEDCHQIFEVNITSFSIKKIER